MKRFKIIDLRSISHYLEFSIEQNSDQIILNQTIYLKHILERFNMKDCASVSIFIKSDTFGNLFSSSIKQMKKLYTDMNQ